MISFVSALLKAKTPKPAGVGWSRIPKGKHGGWHRRTTRGWEQWYPPQHRDLIPRRDAAEASDAVDVAGAIDRQAMIGVPIMVSYGVGVDSTAILVGMHQRGQRPDAILFADTGGENPSTYAYLPIINTWLASVGFPAVTVVRKTPETVRATGKMVHTLEERCRSVGMLPSLAYGGRGCSQKWKHEPQNRWAREWQPAVRAHERGYRVSKFIGYEAEDEPQRKQVEADGEYAYAYPLREWGWNRDRCKKEIAAAGLPVPQKSSCFF